MRKLLSNIKPSTGFTLIELLIVVAIIVIVIAVGAVSYTTVARNSRNSQRQADLQKIANALEEFYADYREYPPASPASALSDCLTGSSCPTVTNTNKYLSVLPADPTPGSNYTYTTNATRQIYELTATGEPSSTTYKEKSPTN